ncbi:hypothetical protein LshimejAT787_1100790 [Lyophyllum shimeji]|uniref:Uncharacterized protein n=1 Tax=Lyophyllum shimeji TaxID=47721 RepID=A0A9P3PV17_LYOSH|nr:hypothetical protein LshimejAT787_1100790 [Lyophyllum shimeji]
MRRLAGGNVSHFIEMHYSGPHLVPSWRQMTPEEVVATDALQSRSDDVWTKGTSSVTEVPIQSRVGFTLWIK